MYLQQAIVFVHKHLRNFPKITVYKNKFTITLVAKFAL